MHKFIKNNRMVLLVGPSGCGKTNLIRNYLNSVSNIEYEINRIHFSAHTSASHTQESVLTKMIK